MFYFIFSTLYYVSTLVCVFLLYKIFTLRRKLNLILAEEPNKSHNGNIKKFIILLYKAFGVTILFLILSTFTPSDPAFSMYEHLVKEILFFLFLIVVILIFILKFFPPIKKSIQKHISNDNN